MRYQTIIDLLDRRSIGEYAMDKRNYKEDVQVALYYGDDEVDDYEFVDESLRNSRYSISDRTGRARENYLEVKTSGFMFSEDDLSI